MKGLIMPLFVVTLLGTGCNFFSGGKPTDIYLSEDMDSLNRPRLPLPDHDLVNLSVVEDSSMQSGFVRVRMMISEEGKVLNPTISKGLGAREDSLAINRTKNLPDFIPGKINERPVKVIYYLPFVFNPHGSHPPGKR